MNRRRLLNETYRKTATGNPVVVRSAARRYPGIGFPGFTTQDGTPSPENPVDIVNAESVILSVTGANICNASDVVIGGLAGNDGTEFSTNNRVRTGFTQVFPGEYKCFNIPSEYILNNAFTYHGDKTLSRTISARNPITVMPDESYYRASLRKQDSTDFTELEIEDIRKNIQISVNYDVNIEPYKQPQTVTLTPPKPLTKWDRLIRRAGVWGWEYKSNTEVFDGSEDENWRLFPGQKNFYIITESMLSGVKVPGYCDKMIVNITGNQPYLELGRANDYIYANVVDYISSEDVTVWKNWLQSNPITVQYETETSEFIPLSEDEQQAMNALYTFSPTTVVQNSIDTEITLDYKTKRSLEVNV